MFFTLRATLLESNCFFSAAVRNLSTETTELFVDRDPTHFRYILNWMRGSTFLPEDELTLNELHIEAKYYSMMDMVQAIIVKRGMPSIAKCISKGIS